MGFIKIVYYNIYINRYPLCQFRRSYIHSEDSGQPRCFYVSMIGEGVYDSGGPYREILSVVCSKEIINDFQFFIQIPNEKYGLGTSQSYIFNSKYKNKTKYFYFLGILYGICQRHYIRLDIDIHYSIWKYLVNENIDLYDIKDIDYYSKNNEYIFLKL